MPITKLDANQRNALIAISHLFKGEEIVASSEIYKTLRAECDFGELEMTPSELIRDLRKEGYLEYSSSSEERHVAYQLTSEAKSYLISLNVGFQSCDFPATSNSPASTQSAQDVRTTNERFIGLIKLLLNELESSAADKTALLRAIYLNLRLLFNVACSDAPEKRFTLAATLWAVCASSNYLRNNPEVAKHLSNKLHAYGWSTKKRLASEISFLEESTELDTKRGREDDAILPRTFMRPKLA